MFSSLVFALSYKEYNDAAEIISNTVQGFLRCCDLLAFAASLLNNSAQVDRYTRRTTITEPKEFLAILEITANMQYQYMRIKYLTQTFMNR